MTYTVKQLATLAGISARTLHYYDQIGLLKPVSVGENGYRYYEEESLIKLQQILLYRELEIPLEAIKKIMGRRDFDVLSSLEGHKAELHKRIAKIERLIETINHTIGYLKGEQNMNEKQIFEGFSEAQQAEYEKEAMQLYDPETVKASNKRWKAYSEAEKKRILEAGSQIYQRFVLAMPEGAASPKAQACVEDWRRHMEYFWVPNTQQLLGLAQGYNSDSRFKTNFDKIHPQLAEFILQAVQTYINTR